MTNAYTLVGKDYEDGYYYYSDFALRLLPTGGLRAYVIDTSKAQWMAEMSPFTYEVDDNQWHYLALVCDRPNNKLSIYVDGVERASQPAPANFGQVQNAGQPLRAGHYSYYDGWVGGSTSFPGILDDIRVSATPHSAERIARDMDAIPGLRIGSYGQKKFSVTRRAKLQLDRQPVRLGPRWHHRAHIAKRSADRCHCDCCLHLVPSGPDQCIGIRNAPLGEVQLVVSKAGLPDVSVDLQINQQVEFANDLDTRLLGT